jgi:hypothetical protein
MKRVSAVQNAGIYRGHLLIGILLLLVTAGFSQDRPIPAHCKPSVSKWSLLGGVYVNGTLRLGELNLAFDCEPKLTREAAFEYVSYQPYQGARLVSNLKNSRGKVINSFAWYGRGDFLRGVRMSHYEIVGGAEALNVLAPGDYALEFSLDNKVFQTFPFSVITKTSTDIYRPGIIYLLEGPWRDEGILEGMGCFNFRLRASYELADAKPTPVSFDLRLARDKDKKLIGERDGKLTLDNTWRSHRVCFDRPDRETTKDHSTIKLQEIATASGGYTISLSYDGKPYAIYRFVAQNGRINGEDPTVRNFRLTLPATILRRDKR